MAAIALHLACILTLAGPGNWEAERQALASVLTQVPATGLLIFHVVEGSKAHTADLRVGDIITHYDGQAVATHLDLIQQARLASNDKRSEILLIVNRGGKELEATLPAGPMGIRIEDVQEGETRPLDPPTGPAPAQNLAALKRTLSAGEHRWYVIHRPDQDAPAGWMHHYLRMGDNNTGVLRVQQELAVNDSRFLQDIVVRFELDDLLSLTGLQVWTNERPILSVTRGKNEYVGQRVGVPVQAALEPATISSYLLPYLAETFHGTAPAGREIAYLKPVSIETAPLSRIDYFPPSAERDFPAVTLTVFGRRELACRLDAGKVASIEARDGMSANLTTQEEILASFPNAESAFPAIEQVPAPPTPGQAN